MCKCMYMLSYCTMYMYIQRDGRGLTRVLTHTVLAIKLMTVFWVDSVQEHQQEQLDLPEARS
jgi:hypothetical protein